MGGIVIAKTILSLSRSIKPAPIFEDNMKIDMEDSVQSAILAYHAKYGKWPENDQVFINLVKSKHSSSIRTEKRRDRLTSARRANVACKARYWGIHTNVVLQ